MKRILKILGITIGALVLLLVVLAIALPLILDPNDYKPEIVQAVKEQTGRDLALEGDINLSVFPWLGLELGNTRLSNAPGFGKKPFLQVDKIEVKVELLPLLRKQILVDKVVLDGMQLNLARDRKGRTNWDDLMQPAETTAPAKTPAAGQPADTGAGYAFGIAGFDIKNGELHWLDATDGSNYHIRQLALRTGKVAYGSPVDLHLSFDMESGKPVVKTRVALDGDVMFDPQSQRLQSKKITLQAAGLSLTASVDGSQVLDRPSFKGKLSLADFNVRKFMTDLNLAAPTTADAQVLTRASMQTRFNATTSQVGLSDLKLSLDDSAVTGNASVGLDAQQAIRFKLTLNDIDVDRYLPPTAPAADEAAKKQAAASQPIAIPVKLLRQLDVNGRFAVGKMKAFGIRSTDIVLPIYAKGGLIKVGPNSARLYTGRYRGQMNMDVRKGVPRYRINEKLTGVQIGPFLKDADIFDKFSGQGDVSAAVTARGMDVDDVLNTVNGKAAFKLKNGRVKGLNLHKMVLDAKAAYAKAQGRPVTAKAQANEEMEFSNTSGTVTIKNGVATNKDLRLKGPFISVKGAGNANLPRQKLDYRLQVRITDDSGKTRSDDLPVPVRVYGELTDPTFSIEWNKILKKAAEQAVKKRVEEEKKKLNKQLQDEIRKRLGF